MSKKKIKMEIGYCMSKDTGIKGHDGSTTAVIRFFLMKRGLTAYRLCTMLKTQCQVSDAKAYCMRGAENFVNNAGNLSIVKSTQLG